MLKNFKNSKSKEKKKIESHSTLEINKKDIIYQIKIIFNNYSKNKTYLSNSQYKIFVIEASLLDNILTPEYSDVLFYSYSYAKDSITFKQFLELMFKLSEIKFHEQYKENQTKALILFFNIFISPLIKIYSNDNKQNKNNISENKNNSDISFNDINHKFLISKISSLLSKEIIEDNYLLFLKIYQKYFCFENLKISRTQKKHLSQKAFVKFNNDFNICPQFLNSEKIVEIFESLIDYRENTENIMNRLINVDLCNNDGMWFTLFHFIVGLYLISIYNVIITNYDKNNPANIWEIFMNNNDSQAFENMIKLLYKSPNLKKVMPDDIKKMQNMILDYKNKTCNFSDENNNNSNINESNISDKQIKRNNKDQNQLINDNNNINETQNEIFKNNYENNYYNNNYKQNNNIKSNKPINTNKHSFLPNFVNDRIKKIKSFIIKNKSNKQISSIMNISSKINENPNDCLSFFEMAPILLKKYKKQLMV